MTDQSSVPATIGSRVAAFGHSSWAMSASRMASLFGVPIIVLLLSWAVGTLVGDHQNIQVMKQAQTDSTATLQSSLSRLDRDVRASVTNEYRIDDSKRDFAIRDSKLYQLERRTEQNEHDIAVVETKIAKR